MFGYIYNNLFGLIWLLRKREVYLFVLLSVLFAFFLLRLVYTYNTYKERDVVVYNIPNNIIILFVNNGFCYLFSEKNILYNGSDYYIKEYLINRRVNGIKYYKLFDNIKMSIGGADVFIYKKR
jgi:hypothetical protein